MTLSQLHHVSGVSSALLTQGETWEPAPVHPSIRTRGYVCVGSPSNTAPARLVRTQPEPVTLLESTDGRWFEEVVSEEAPPLSPILSVEGDGAFLVSRSDRASMPRLDGTLRTVQSPHAYPDIYQLSADEHPEQYPYQDAERDGRVGHTLCGPTAVSMVTASEGTTLSLLESAKLCWHPHHKLFGVWRRMAATLSHAIWNDVPFIASPTWMTGYDELATLLEAEVHCILSLAWDEDELPGAPLARSAGHFMVAHNLDAARSVVGVHDPRAELGTATYREYPAEAFLRAWQRREGGAIVATTVVR